LETLRSHPVEPQIWNDLRVCLSLCDELVGKFWGGLLQSRVQLTFDRVKGRSLEERLKQLRNPGPDVSINVEVEVIFRNIDNDIDSVDSWYDSSIMEGLRLKRHT